MNNCHYCGKPGKVVKTSPHSYRVEGVPFCSGSCHDKSRIRPGDEVVLDSGYMNDQNGIPFRVLRARGGEFVGFVRGKRVYFTQEMAAKTGTARAKRIELMRQAQLLMKGL